MNQVLVLGKQIQLNIFSNVNFSWWATRINGSVDSKAFFHSLFGKLQVPHGGTWGQQLTTTTDKAIVIVVFSCEYSSFYVHAVVDFINETC